jgi:hypothetical protein
MQTTCGGLRWRCRRWRRSRRRALTSVSAEWGFGTASISERENREIEAANASGNTPVVFRNCGQSELPRTGTERTREAQVTGTHRFARRGRGFTSLLPPSSCQGFRNGYSRARPHRRIGSHARQPLQTRGHRHQDHERSRLVTVRVCDAEVRRSGGHLANRRRRCAPGGAFRVCRCRRGELEATGLRPVARVGWVGVTLESPVAAPAKPRNGQQSDLAWSRPGCATRCAHLSVRSGGDGC